MLDRSEMWMNFVDRNQIIGKKELFQFMCGVKKLAMAPSKLETDSILVDYRYNVSTFLNY